MHKGWNSFLKWSLFLTRLFRLCQDHFRFLRYQITTLTPLKGSHISMFFKDWIQNIKESRRKIDIFLKYLFIRWPVVIKTTAIFLCPRNEWSGAYCFLTVCPSVCLFVCLFVCLSVVNFNIRYNFWTVRGRDCVCGMHTWLIMPFQMTPRSMTLWLWLWPLF